MVATQFEYKIKIVEIHNRNAHIYKIVQTNPLNIYDNSLDFSTLYNVVVAPKV